MLATLEQVTTIISVLGKLPRIGPDEDIFAAGFSSIRALELLMELESVFEISLPDDQFAAARTPGDFTNLVDQVRAEAS